MADITISSVIGDIEKYKFNPVMIQRVALEALRIASNDEVNIVDPTNPFIFCLENTATNTAAFMQQNEASTRRLYPSASLTDEDLYLHMSDKDYIGRFASPSSAIFTIILLKDELLPKLVLEPITGIRKITIPRNTYFTIADVVFSLQYPIDIRLLNHGGLQIVYDTSQVSPLQTLSTNIVQWEEITDSSNLKYIKFDVEASQFSIITSYNQITSASGFKTDIAIEDDFYYARCYIQDSLGVYNEIQTTHTQQVYDIYTPTAVITVLDKLVKVSIPVIYINTNMIKGKLRIDIYQTKGYLDMLLGNYNLDSFNANWFNINKVDDNTYTTPIRSFKTIAVYSTTHVFGGRSALGFLELRSRVIQNAIGVHSLPVTNIQLKTTLEDNGYEVVRNIDTVTNRIYLATRNLPKPADTKIITAASASMSSVLFKISEVINCYGVISNTDSITLTPDVVYSNVNGVIKPISKIEYNYINELPRSQKCAKITNGSYFYSPFHYILDYSGETFEVRPYYLDSPVIETKSFVEENVSTGLQVSMSSAYSVRKTESGFTLTFSVKSSATYKNLLDNQVMVQIGFNYKNYFEKSYMLGTLIGVDDNTKERMFKFEINSNFNIDAYGYLNVGSFEYISSSLEIKSQLLQEMDVYFITTETMPSGWVRSQIDDELGVFQLPLNAKGITHEKIKIRFGFSLDNLWVQSRSFVEEIPYQRYTANIPAVYENDVYEKDPITGSIFKLDTDGKILLDTNGKPVFVLLHSKGDPILDQNLVPVFKYNIGEIMTDSYGLPIPVQNYKRELIRDIDILTIDGAYYFSNDPVVTDYIKSITDSLLNWITVDLIKFNSTLLDQTKIYFFPKVTLGDIRVLTLNGIEATIPAGQSLLVKLHVNTLTYNNQSLLDSLSKSTIRILDEALKNIVISVSAIESKLMTEYDSDVINVELNGISGNKDLKAFTILDKSNSCSIKKKLTLLPDNKMVVEEDITIVYINHSVNK